MNWWALLKYYFSKVQTKVLERNAHSEKLTQGEGI